MSCVCVLCVCVSCVCVCPVFQVRRRPATRCIRTCTTSRSDRPTTLSALGRPWRKWTGRTAAWSSCQELTWARCRSTTTPSGRYTHTHTHTHTHTQSTTSTHTCTVSQHCVCPQGGGEQDVPRCARLWLAAPQSAPGDGEGRHRLLPPAAHPRLRHEPDRGLPQGTALPTMHLVVQRFPEQTPCKVTGFIRYYWSELNILWIRRHLCVIVCDHVCVFPGHLLSLRQRWVLLHRRERNHTGKHRGGGEGDRVQEVRCGRNHIQGQRFTSILHSLIWNNATCNRLLDFEVFYTVWWQHNYKSHHRVLIFSV